MIYAWKQQNKWIDFYFHTRRPKRFLPAVRKSHPVFLLLLQVFCNSTARQERPSSLKELFSACLKSLTLPFKRAVFCKMSDFCLKSKKVPAPGSNRVTSPSLQIKGPLLAVPSFHMSWAPLPVSQKKHVNRYSCGFSVPAHAETFLLLLFSPIQSLVSQIRAHPLPYILFHDSNQDRLSFSVNELRMQITFMLWQTRL